VNAQLTNGLTAHYTFDDQTFNDQSGNENHATNDLTTATTDRFGNLDQARNFGGNESIKMKDDLLDFGTALTFSVWFKTTSTGSVNPIVGYQDNPNVTNSGAYVPMIFIAADNTIKAKMWDGNNNSIVNSNIVVTDGQWHNIVLTADASGQTIVLDKQVIANSGNGYTPLGLKYNQLGLAKSNSWQSGAFTDHFVGDIDDIRVYNYKNTSQTFFNALFHEGGYLGPAAIETIYVNANAVGANNGSSWFDAYTDAREAFINATQNDEIWIAQGTYVRSGTNRDFVFGWTRDSIKVYGGFSGNGTETSITQRDWNAYPTIFSGDIGTVGDFTDNARTVFIGPIGDMNYALIDGIKITGGNADANNYPEFNSMGGGMVVDTEVDHIELKNVAFYGNYAKQGAAISAYGISGDDCRITLENIVAHNNTGKSSAFAHFRASNVASIEVEMTNCLIHENNVIGTVEDFGTVLFLGSNANISNTLFANITNCTFADNTYVTGHRSKGMIRVFNQTNAPSILNFTNNISYGNNIEDITDKNWSNTAQPFPTINLNNNILETGIDVTATLENNTISSDPLFNADYSLQIGSPAIDAGTQTGITVPLLDLAGNNRIVGSEIDLGAYEYNTTCTVTIPDANFKASLLAASTINTNGNSEIECTEAAAYTGYIDGFGQNISDFTGIESFPNITGLIIYDNPVSSIDISTNTLLEALNVSSMNLSSLDLSNNLLLEDLNISKNQLEALDLSLHNNLSYLLCNENTPLTSLNIANQNNSNLITFQARLNPNLDCVKVDDPVAASSYSNWSIDANTSYSVDCTLTNIRTDKLDKTEASIYPNPTTDAITIEVDNLVEVNIYNTSGRLIQSETVNKINLSHLPTGVYTFQIISKNWSSIHKVVKNN